MVEIDDVLAQALKCNVAFAAYMLPGQVDGLHIVAQLPGRSECSDRVFNIAQWNSSSAGQISIKDTVTIDEMASAIALLPVATTSSHRPWQQSTTPQQHCDNVERIVAKLKAQGGGKIVLSRAITGKLDCRYDAACRWVSIARRYFKSLPSTFRYIYNTPQTGAWIGASPEVLLSADKSSGYATTMSLAGTRKVDVDSPWDEKNVEEHNLVTRFITEQLDGMGLKYDVARRPGVAFKGIEHLCDMINFDLRDVDPYEVIDRLNPTPALSGYPRSEAIAELARLEKHSRYCYGGYVAVDDNTSLSAYVNLRCVNFVDRDYCMYAGGGITSLSSAADEWLETERKIAPLRGVILDDFAAV